MADNLDQGTGNQDQTETTGGLADTTGGQAVVDASVSTTVTNAPAPETGWKSGIGEDLSGAPALQKFEDTPDGLAKVAESYVNLEKLLSHDKVPLPKGADDLEGRAAFNKAIGVPETSTEYNLKDVTYGGELGKISYSKEGFSEVVHKYGLTPEQATGLWKEYTEGANNVYHAHEQQLQDNLNTTINMLRSEWGDAYAANVELGQLVITKFAEDQDMGDFLTATLSKDPAGMKFLAKVGTQFSENKVGGFQYQKFSVSPDEAMDEITKIKADPKHAYNDLAATEKDHAMAVDQVNRLISISRGKSA